MQIKEGRTWGKSEISFFRNGLLISSVNFSIGYCVIGLSLPHSLKSQLDAVNLPIVSEGANEASYKAAYESLLAEKESGMDLYIKVLKLLHKLQQLKQQLQSSKPVSITVEEANHQTMLPTN